MTLLEDQPTRDRPPQRTWRDLPASPPVGTILAPPDPATLVGGASFADETAQIDFNSYGTPPPVEPLAAPNGGHHRGRKALVALGIVAVVAGIAGGLAIARDGDSNGLASSNGNGNTTPTLPSGSKGGATDVAAALGPAVVQIEIGGGLANGGGVGSGVIYDASGLVLTAHHVVATSDQVTVRLGDGRTFNGRVVGRAPEKDLAIVALDGADDLTAATIAEPGSVEVGETAIALGSPFGYQASVTAGIISGLDRELETPEGTLSGLIQTDAPINPGNSGGPLADADAKVIGINTAIASMSGGNDGVGFAIPVEQFTDLLDQVQQAGGADAPTIAAPESSSSTGGLDQLIPGLDDLIPGLGDILPGNGQLPDLQQLLDQLFGDAIPDSLKDILKGLLPDSQQPQDSTPDSTTPNSGGQGG